MFRWLRIKICKLAIRVNEHLLRNLGDAPSQEAIDNCRVDLMIWTERLQKEYK